MISRQCEAFMGNDSLFLERFLVNPRLYNSLGVALARAPEAVLLCGRILRGDLCFFRNPDGNFIARIICFWQVQDANNMLAQVDQLTQVDADSLRLWDRGRTVTKFIDVDLLIDAVMFYESSPNIVRVIVPLGATL